VIGSDLFGGSPVPPNSPPSVHAAFWYAEGDAAPAGSERRARCYAEAARWQAMADARADRRLQEAERRAARCGQLAATLRRAHAIARLRP
jgi:hypothetical protein